MEWCGMETDIVIPVIGPIGAGKSTFINTASNSDLKVDHGVNSCTAKPCAVVVDKLDFDKLPNLEGHRLVLVDTPGFDNSDPLKDDEKVLKQIDTWLEKSYPEKVIIGGVVYVHDITNKIFKEADRRVIRKFHVKYGDSAIQNTILATTNWGPPKPEGSESRERELRNIHWAATTTNGAKVRRFLRNSESAWAIIYDLLERIAEPQMVSKSPSVGKKVKIEGINFREFLRSGLRGMTTAPAGCTVQ